MVSRCALALFLIRGCVNKFLRLNDTVDNLLRKIDREVSAGDLLISTHIPVGSASVPTWSTCAPTMPTSSF